jgi:carbamoyl-phosphate synthase large subunit
MPNIEFLTPREPGGWLAALEACAPYDFYHLPQYHAMAEQAGEGDARLFVYTEGGYTIAMPLLLRKLDGGVIPALAEDGWNDATSVYGYPGPIGAPPTVPDGVARNFQVALVGTLKDMRAVSAFSRLHPLLSGGTLLPGPDVYPVSRTVAIDLTLPLEVQRSRYRKNHREAINRLRRRGLTCLRDRDGTYFEDFIRIYYETMRRVQAAERYFFPRAYFLHLAEALGSRLNLFVCLQDGVVISAGLFVACQGIVQYHLGGTADDALKLAPMKLLIDEVRHWANAEGLRVFHLGGGATPRSDDTLLHFKMGFSDCTEEFAVWKRVLFPEVYERLCDLKRRFDERKALRPAAEDFFPKYRSPTVAATPDRPAPSQHRTGCARGRTPMNVLLTCAGRRNYLVQFFKNALRGRGRVLACDYSGAAPAIFQADRHFIVPAMDDPGYFDALLAICRAQEVRLCFSVNDLELTGLAREAPRFRDAGTIVVVASPETLATCQDKWAAFRFMRAHDIPTPDTYLSVADALRAVSRGLTRFPLIIKPRWGTSSIGIEVVEDERELEAACAWGRIRLQRTILARLDRSDPDHGFIVQPWLRGEEYGLDVVNDMDGNYACTLARRKLVMRAGNTDRAVTAVDPALERLGRSIGVCVRHVGSLDCDVIAAEGGYRVLDLNPRFGGGYPFSHLAGADLPAALIAWALGEEPDPAWLRARPGVLVSKFDGVTVIDPRPEVSLNAHAAGVTVTTAAW